MAGAPALIAVAALVGAGFIAAPAAAAVPLNDNRVMLEIVGPLPAVVTGDTSLGTASG